MKRYPIYLLDADDTLFDFGKAERNAFFKTFTVMSGEVCTEERYAAYSRLNSALWKALERREITKQELQRTRFGLFLKEQGLNGDGMAWNEAYLDRLAEGCFLLDGALEACQELSKSSRLYIATNGVTRVQKKRLADSAVAPYISGIFVSEEAGAEKPDIRYFHYVLERLGNPDRRDLLMVGDSLTSDMAGGCAAGIDTCWFCPVGKEQPTTLPITVRISALSELFRG